MITKQELILAGAPRDLEITGYWHAKLRAPYAVAGTSMEYALIKQPDVHALPQLWLVAKAKPPEKISDGLQAVGTFMEIVGAATMSEVT